MSFPKSIHSNFWATYATVYTQYINTAMYRYNRPIWQAKWRQSEASVNELFCDDCIIALDDFLVCILVDQFRIVYGINQWEYFSKQEYFNDEQIDAFGQLLFIILIKICLYKAYVAMTLAHYNLTTTHDRDAIPSNV